VSPASLLDDPAQRYYANISPTDHDSDAVLLVVALEGCCIGLAAINRARLGDTVPADRLLQKPQRSLFVPLCGEQTVNSVAVLIHDTGQIPPLTFPV